MKYTNPIISCDFSDPDAIRVGENYYLVASSFSFVPGIPVLESKNLVDFKIVNYVYKKIPIHGYKSVNYGFGAWAPSIRYHKGTYYCLIPFPDIGIFVSKTKDPKKKWSKPKLLIKQVGLEDPCPIWIDNKCYVVVAFAKSRIGFNSKLAVYETSPDLSKCLDSTYTIIYDGTKTQPTIEGPKCYTRNGYIYILAPAGGVKYGWQVALRSKSILGPFEERIILSQKDTNINGPHQGALIDTPDGNFAFIHFRDMGAYGRVLYLEKASFLNDWPVLGNNGAPEHCGIYLVKVPAEGDYSGNSLNSISSLEWQTPANKKRSYFKFRTDSITLYCVNKNIKYHHLISQLLTQKIRHFSLDTKISLELNLKKVGDEAGTFVLGNDYAFLLIKKTNTGYNLEIIKGQISKGEDIIYSKQVNISKKQIVDFLIEIRNVDSDNFNYTFSFCGERLPFYFSGAPLRWTGSRIGVYAKGSKGYACLLKFEQLKVSK